jgi:hypothetical protein
MEAARERAAALAGVPAEEPTLLPPVAGDADTLPRAVAAAVAAASWMSFSGFEGGCRALLAPAKGDARLEPCRLSCADGAFCAPVICNYSVRA